MKTCRMGLAWTAVGIFAVAGALHAQDVAGTWQGTVSGEKQQLRVVLQIEKGSDGALHGKAYSIDQTPTPAGMTTVSFADSILKFTVDAFHATYEGRMSPDGKTIAGTMTQGTAKPLNLERATPQTAWKIDASPHTVQFVTVEKDVKLEVLDWGGTGRPLVLLTGLGNDAHIFDKFAQKLTDKYHVYGITRRGFGESSKPSPEGNNYAAERMGEDVIAVLDALHLEKPVLAGHSVAGEELSYVGNSHPERVAGLIYLDAGYSYALYDEVNGAAVIDMKVLREQLERMAPGKMPQDQNKFLAELHENLVRVEKEVAFQQEQMKDMPPPPPPPAGGGPKPPPAGAAIIGGVTKFTTIKAPVLAIFADPHDIGNAFKDNPKARAAFIESNNRSTEQQAVAFERQVPSAHVVRIPNAQHYVFISNEADVLREMNAFIATLN
ncbi:alpha/beta fold hydrolase [Edaphobacter sp. HDX4]|uniref:alpha/beta fold hydrolase n=1 Tax=Edaphobacter sp. HDX4 TaxID=2794064 RepID=UPI002FE6713B